MKLNEEEILRFIKYRDKQEGFDFTVSEELNIVKLYNTLSLDSKYINSDKDEHMLLLNQVIQQTVNKRNPENDITDEKIKRYLGSNKHMNYFDIFLKLGAAKDIEDALNAIGLSTDVLKGIPKNQKYISAGKVINGKVLQIEQLTNKDVNVADPDSIYVVSFVISYDGKVIYEFNAKDVADKNKGDIGFIKRLQRGGIDVGNAEYKSDKIKGQGLFGFTTADGEFVNAEIVKTKKGKNRRIYRGEDGRFISKRDIIENLEDF